MFFMTYTNLFLNIWRQALGMSQPVKQSQELKEAYSGKTK